MKRLLIVLLSLACLCAQGADHVVIISLDGLGSSYLEDMVQAGRLPALKRIQEEAAGTLNARADFDITVTLPNHTSMVTSRRIKGDEGHGWTHNTDPAKGVTMHSAKGNYVASVFDVAHDHGLRTGLWATKTKFSLFQVSYDACHGAPDTTGPDNGRNKLDQFFYAKSSDTLTDNFLAALSNAPCNLALVHFGEGDGAGHGQGWGSEAYQAAMVKLDQQLGRIMDQVSTLPSLKANTVLIITADHGGAGKDHGDPAKAIDYTVPFYVWGGGIPRGDLYALNAGHREDPGRGRPDFNAPLQPVRNGEAGNLALSLLGLPPIPGSMLNSKQDLKVKP